MLDIKVTQALGIISSQNSSWLIKLCVVDCSLTMLGTAQVDKVK